jgi:hypothetical protein
VDWSKALCANLNLGHDPFFPTIVDSEGEEWLDDGTIWAAFGDTDPYYAEARAICDKCPIKEECRQHAIDNKERWGYWNSTPIERRRVERRERRERRKLRLQEEQNADD